MTTQKKENTPTEKKENTSTSKNVSIQFTIHSIRDVISFYIKNAYKIPENKKITSMDYYIDTQKEKIIIQFAVTKDDEA